MTRMLVKIAVLGLAVAGTASPLAASAASGPAPPTAAAPAATVADAAGPAARVPGSALASPLARALSRQLTGGSSIGGVAVDRGRLGELYRRRGARPLWLDDDGVPTAPARALYRAIEAADADGLDPEAYHLRALATRLVPSGPDDSAAFELLLSDAAMRYLIDLRVGRVRPAQFHREWSMPRVRRDPVRELEAAAAAPDIAAHIAGWAPAHPLYRGARALLAHYRGLARAGGWPALPEGRRSLELGMTDARIARLRARLAATGDLDPALPVTNRFDATLRRAVMAYQLRNGLATDGVVGPRTRAALNQTVAQRIGTVVATLERLRWLPDRLGDRHVLVNIPAFTLTAVDRGEVREEMAVIVGRAARPTPVMASRIDRIVFNPPWTVPVRLAREDILPKLARDPEYLARRSMAVYSSWSAGATRLDPLAVDWASLGAGVARYRFTQSPGRSNPLGRVKFSMPNEYDIYLHDTPARSKFARARRAYSSGCVRVEDPDALLAFVFAGERSWSAGQRRAALNSGRTRHARVARPVPVYLVYATAWLEPDGRFAFREDLYDRDEDLLAAIGHDPSRPRLFARLTE